MNAIKGFQDKYRFLSNFWPAEVSYKGYVFPSVEHAYQAAKCVDVTKYKDFITCTAGEAKRMGRRVEIRKDWNAIKLNIMLTLVRQKFINHQHLRDSLVLTGDAYLEETNYWHDTFWGVCNGEGTNFLGFILMLVRWEIRVKGIKNA